MHTAHLLRRAWQALRPGQPPAARRTLVVQHLGFDGADLDSLPAVLEQVGRDLGVDLRLDGAGGDVVLAEQAFVARVAPQVLHAFLEERPLLTLAPPARNHADAARRARELHAGLVGQLQTLSDDAGPVRGLAAPVRPDSGFDSAFDSRQQVDALAVDEPDPDRAELLNRLRRGLVDPGQPPLRAAYGPRASLVIDFATGIARLDELADQRLRVSRELPASSPHAQPGAGARCRDLDLVAWDLALAAAGFRLLHSPVAWWRTPLIVQPGLDVTRYTRLPQHLALARRLAQGPAAPGTLRRDCRVSLAELRGFLQALLLLGLARWLPDGAG